MKKIYKAVMAEHTVEEAVLTITPDIEINNTILNEWVRDVTKGQLKVTEKEGIMCFVPSSEKTPEFRVIPSYFDDGTLRFRIYSIHNVMQIIEV